MIIVFLFSIEFQGSKINNLFFLNCISESQRDIIANDRVYNSKFNYAVSIIETFILK